MRDLADVHDCSVANRAIVLRNARLVAAALLIVTFLIEAWILIAGFRKDHVPVDRATYVGTLIGVLTAVVAITSWAVRASADPLERLQSRLAVNVFRRLEQLRLTADEIDLTLRVSLSGELQSMAQFVDDVAGNDIHRVLLTGVQGGGKSYVVLRVAHKILNASDRLPIIVPLSRWTPGSESLDDFLASFLHDEFNLSLATQESLIARARIVPIFDGLDEIPDLERRAQTLEEFLQALYRWRPAYGDTRYVVSVRVDAWQTLASAVRERVDADLYNIQEIDPGTAAAYLGENVGLAAPPDTGVRLLAALQASNLYEQVNRASRLSMLGVLLARYTRRTEYPDTAILKVVDAVRESRLPEIYLDTLLTRERQWRRRILNAMVVSALSSYARYLRDNASGREISGRKQNPRNITLHRVWPISGTSSRIADVILALVLSFPGLAWLAYFLSRFDGFGWLVWSVFLLLWMAMLGRTAWKPWVRAAVPDFSRISQPRFFVRQAAASIGAGAITALFAPPWAALAVAVTAWLLIGLSVGFGQTLTTDAQVLVVGPTGVLHRDRQVSLLAGLAAFPGVTLAFSSTFGFPRGLLFAAVYCLVVGATVASALWRRYLALCLVRARDLLTPTAIMLGAVRLNLVREGGLTYQFREDEIAAYIASLPRSLMWAWRVSRAEAPTQNDLIIE